MRALAALLLCLALQAHAQSTPVPIAAQVERLAPHLVAFAGSRGNFENLVNGMSLGVPVTLTTVGANGPAQVVTFAAPGGPVADPVAIARTLETARQQLIAAGVGAPTAQQLGEAVAGVPVPATVVPGAAPAPGTAAASPSGVPPAALPSPAEQIQSRGTALAPRTNTSDSTQLGNTSASPVPPPAGVGASVASPPALPASPALGAPAAPASPPPAAGATAPPAAPSATPSPAMRAPALGR